MERFGKASLEEQNSMKSSLRKCTCVKNSGKVLVNDLGSLEGV